MAAQSGARPELQLLRPVDSALELLRLGRPVVLVGDQGGELVFAAEAATPALLAFMVRETSGLICVALPEAECDRLRLPLMYPYRDRTDGFRFTVSVDAVNGITTGISARDRAHTIRLLGGRTTAPGELSRPGHVLPVRASDGGVLQEAGFPEAAVELVASAGRGVAAAMGRIVSTRDGRQLAGPRELAAFADEHGLAVIGVRDVVAARACELLTAAHDPSPRQGVAVSA